MTTLINDWAAVFKESKLYSMDTGRLTNYWRNVPTYYPIKPEAMIIPQILLEAAEMSKLTAVLEVIAIDNE